MRTAYRSLLVTASIMAVLSPAYSQNEAFSDISWHRYRNAIEFLSKEWIVNGYPDGTFHPDEFVNRAELVKTVLSSNRINLSNPQPNCFPDIREDWHVSNVCTAKKLNIVGGYGDGNFKPNQAVSFVEALKIIERAYGANLPTTDPWYKAYVDEASSKNMIPLDVNSFDQKINRWQLADIITRHLKYLDWTQKDYLASSFGNEGNRAINYDNLANQGSEAKWILEWKISIGPICSAQDMAQNNNCQPSEQTYKDWQVSVWSENKKTFITQLAPGLDGNFRIELPPGKYVVDFESRQIPTRTGSQWLPMTVTIRPWKPVSLSIDVDTGIR